MERIYHCIERLNQGNMAERHKIIPVPFIAPKNHNAFLPFFFSMGTAVE